MKIKNYNHIIMNRDFFCFKWQVIFVLTVLISWFGVLNAANPKAQPKNENNIRGVIIDARSKQPISAAQISIPEMGFSAVSDSTGSFEIQTLSPTANLHVIAFDYNSCDFPLRGQRLVKIQLYSDKFSPNYKNIQGLNGVVSSTTSDISIKGIDKFSYNTAISADDMLQTALGGDVRSISRSGTAGIGSSLFIRGINSLNANAQPLFVVDGVIWNNLYDVQSIHEGYFGNTLDNIDVNDIESISVLKDGTSIYGSKGANGVILIKTKRSNTSVTKISLDVSSGITTMPSKLPMMNGEDFRVYSSDLIGSTGVTGTDISSYNFLQTDPANSLYNVYHNNTNWANEVFQNGSTNSYKINAMGGDDKAMYYFSIGLTNNSGVVKTTDMQRINSRFNADLNLLKNLKMGINIGFTRIERKLIDDGVDNYSSPVWMSYIKAPFLSPNSFTFTGQKSTDYAYTDDFQIGNPGAVINYSVNSMKSYRVNLGLLPTLKITPELTLSSQFDYDLDKDIEGHYIPMNFTPVQYLENLGYSYNKVSSQVMRNTAIFDETKLSYEKQFDILNHFRAILGWRYIYNYYESDFVEEHNTGSNNNTTITGTYAYLNVNGINNTTKSISNYLNLDYDFAKRYFVTATVSMDGSSRFGKQTEGGIHLFNRSWGLFPSVNGAWLVSSENFMKNINFIDLLKVRAGYGLTGNDGIPDYQALAYFASVRYMDRANGLILSNLENSTIQWETSAKVNGGIDLGLFNDRLSFSVDLFKTNISNMLMLRDFPTVSGLGKYWDNGGSMQNSGYEISANWKVLNLNSFKWEFGLSVGHYDNVVTQLPYGNYTTSVYGGEVLTAVGQPAGVFYGYKTAGVFATDAQAQAANLKIKNADGTFSTFGAGDMIFVDKNSDGIIDASDKQVIGNPNPKLYGSISNAFHYKNLSLNAVFTYSYGNSVYNYFRSQLESGSNFYNQTTAMLNRWTADGQVTNVPKAVIGDPMRNSRFSDRWIEDGSYLRLKTVTLSYKVPIKSNFIDGFNVWISANNLLTFTKYLGLDPEFSTNNSVYYQGVDAGLIPLTKSYYLGIKFDL